MDGEDVIRGRGTGVNTPNRFELIRYDRDADCWTDEDRPSPATQLLRDHSRSIIATSGALEDAWPKAVRVAIMN